MLPHTEHVDAALGQETQSPSVQATHPRTLVALLSTGASAAPHDDTHALLLVARYLSFLQVVQVEMLEHVAQSAMTPQSLQERAVVPAPIP